MENNIMQFWNICGVKTIMAGFAKRASTAVWRTVRSPRFAAVLLMAIAVGCLWRTVCPGPSETELLAREIQDQNFRKWYASIGSEREKASIRAALDAYSRKFGSAVWAKHALEDFRQDGRVRYADFLELAMSIGNRDDRMAFARENAAAYEAMNDAGLASAARDWAATMRALKEKGGRDWRVARRDPLAAAVYAATVDRKEPGLWDWYLDNREWAEDYIRGIAIEANEDDGVPDVASGICAVLGELRKRAPVFMKLREEVVAEAESPEYDGFAEKDVSAFLAGAFGTVSAFGDVFSVLRKANAPMVESLDVLANNLDAYVLESADACADAGADLANVYRNHLDVWKCAATPFGHNCIKYFHAVPQHAGEVLSRFGEIGAWPFLEKNYSTPEELLAVASEVLVKYGEEGFAVLAHYEGNGEFREALLNKDIGCRVVPYVLFKGAESGAVSACLKNPRWIDRYLNPDGTIKPESESILETLPFVGGIAAAMKHIVKREPLTLEDIGWAAFDVVDDVLTVAALTGALVAAPVTGGTSVPAAVAEESARKAAITAAKQGAKNGAKLAVRQGERQMVKTGGRYILKKESRELVEIGGKALVKRNARRSLIRSVSEKALETGAWTVRLGDRAVKLAAKPVVLAVDGWKKLPPATRKFAVRAAAGSMLFIALTERTLPTFPGAFNETMKRAGKATGDQINGAIKGTGSFLEETVKATIGVSGSGLDVSLVKIAVGAACALLAVLAWRRGSAERRGPPVRIA